MPLLRRHQTNREWLVALCVAASVGCESVPRDSGAASGAISAHRARALAAARLARDDEAPKLSAGDPAPSPGPTVTQPAPQTSAPAATHDSPRGRSEDEQGSSEAERNKRLTLEDKKELPRQIPDPMKLPAILEEKLKDDLRNIDRDYDKAERERRQELQEKGARGQLTPERKGEIESELKRIRQRRKERKAERNARYHERRDKIINELEAGLQQREVVYLGLSDAVGRALRNNYGIQARSYGPAIQTANIVEAEARFDAVYFAKFSNNKQDRPSASELQGTMYQTRNVESGVRKLLSAGTQVQASYALNRTETDLVFQTLNPSYFNSFAVEFRQPFFRGFGLDVNRADIERYKLEREKSIEQLKMDVQDMIYEVEKAYWGLAGARRRAAAIARLLPDLRAIAETVGRRAAYDARSDLVKLAKARVGGWDAELIQVCADARKAETALKSLMSDPELDRAEDIEIVPIDEPPVEEVILDRPGEITAALMHRPDLRQARLEIQQAAINVGVQKNLALPKLDAVLRCIVDGLGANPDRAFSQLSENDFQEYFVGLEFEWPIGNRGPEAALRRARLQQAAAIAAHRATIEKAIGEVEEAIHDIEGNRDQMKSRFDSAQAQEAGVETVFKRRDPMTPTNLEIETMAHERLVYAREKLLSALVSYNIGLVDLERKKGTLLQYNNIVIQGADDESYLEPYRPIGP